MARISRDGKDLPISASVKYSLCKNGTFEPGKYPSSARWEEGVCLISACKREGERGDATRRGGRAPTNVRTTCSVAAHLTKSKRSERTLAYIILNMKPVSTATTTLRLLLRVVVAAGAITTLTMAAQTVKYAATQADLIAALGNDTTVVLNSTILLETSTNPDGYATGIVIENVKGLVIDGAGFAIDGQGKMRCLYVGENSDVALIDTTVTNGYTEVSKASESKIQTNRFLSFFLSITSH